LRELNDKTDSQRFIFEADLMEDVVQAFTDNVKVEIVGIQNPDENFARAILLSRQKDQSEESLSR